MYFKKWRDYEIWERCDKRKSQIEIKMERGIEERGLEDFESNPVQLIGLQEKGVQSKQ